MINLISFIIGVIVAVFVFRSNRKYFIGPCGPQGMPGSKGDKGDSAYDIARKHGYIGTEEEFINQILNKK